MLGYVLNVQQFCPGLTVARLAGVAGAGNASKAGRHLQMSCCSHCGEEGVELKRCLRCLQVSYCGAECQKANWKLHKNACKPAGAKPAGAKPAGAHDASAQAAAQARETLFRAAWEGKPEEVKRLIDGGANLKATDDVGQSCLHVALMGNKRTLQVLLDAGCNVSAKDGLGRSPLHVAAGLGREEAATMLLDARADVSAKEAKGLSALHYAARGDHKGVIRILRYAGADVAAKDSSGKTALDLAAERGHEGFVRLLGEELPQRLEDVYDILCQAEARSDYRDVLKWEGRMEELLANRNDVFGEYVLRIFAAAHAVELVSADDTRNVYHSECVVTLEMRRAELLGKLGRFKDQGESLSMTGQTLLFLERPEESRVVQQQSRDIGAEHGLFSVECKACCGLGQLAISEGRTDEGLNLLRHALAVASLAETDSARCQLSTLAHLFQELFKAGTLDGGDVRLLDEAGEMMPRFREAAKALSRKQGHLHGDELQSISANAQLLEARGKRQEAMGEWTALLDLAAANKPAVDCMAAMYQTLLRQATMHIAALDPRLAEEHRACVAAALRANLQTFCTFEF